MLVTVSAYMVEISTISMVEMFKEGIKTFFSLHHQVAVDK